MMDKEYIEREALIKKICQDPSENANVRIIQLLDAIILTPTADVVEVVRCKDCKNASKHHCPPYDGKEVVYCSYYMAAKLENDFCSYGIRKDK